MAKTAITDITTEQIGLNKGDPDYEEVTGYLSTDLPPGRWVRPDSANNQWVPLDTDTSEAHKVSGAGVVGYRKRVNQTTGALKIITDNWDISEAEDKRVPIIISGIVVADCDDPGAQVEPLTQYGASANAGKAKVIDVDATPAITQTPIAQAAAPIGNGDTVGIFGIGKCKGKIWGNY